MQQVIGTVVCQQKLRRCGEENLAMHSKIDCMRKFNDGYETQLKAKRKMIRLKVNEELDNIAETLDQCGRKRAEGRRQLQ